MEILKVEDLNFSYPARKEKALCGVSFTVNKGELVAVCGATGSGKTTLLRLLKPELRPLGELSGTIAYSGSAEKAGGIGFVMQRPEQQIVTDKVWHELVFGAENLGLPKEVIRRRAAETASWFGMEEWFDKDVSALSGGQKQLLNLASVMMTQPEILLLDEPAAQLDPIAAADFISTVARLNRELSLTVIMIEHRLEDVIPRADKLMALEDGRLLEFGGTREVTEKLRAHKELIKSMPSAVRVYSGLGGKGACPLTVREGREYIIKSRKNDVKSLERPEKKHGATALELRDVFFRYSRALPDVLNGLELTVYENEIFCLLGGNGSGKSTALCAISGILKPYAGSIRIFGKKQREYKDNSLYRECLALLPQDVQTVFLRSTVREELSECGTDISALPFDLTPLMESHPYDLSGGQQQLVALAKVLGTRPRLLLLDEPTKGLDAASRQRMAELLKKLRDGGMTVLAVTHDVEFAAECADRCGMFFRGGVVSVGVTDGFFAGGSFYTTAADRMTRGYYDGIATVGDILEICALNGERSGNDSIQE